MKTKHKISKIERIAGKIVQRLVSNGYEAYWVGGCVRNKILNLPPEDIDIATSARPEEIISLFRKTIKVGVKFGVVIVMLEGVQTEVATFRSDGEYLDSRRPSSITFSNAEEDAKRRDFTINALFYNPCTDKTSDFVDGMKDLKAGIIRGIGDPAQRIREDALRIMRAVRFAVRFNFRIEEKTYQAIKDNAHLLAKISADRIRTELLKILTGPRAGEAIKVMQDTGILKVILPEVDKMKGVEQPPEFHPEGDVFDHTVLALNLLDNPGETLAAATLFHDVGKPKTFTVKDRIRFNGHDKAGAEITKDICRRLNFSLKDQKTIVALVDRHMMFLNIDKMRPAKLKRFLAAETIEEDLELHRVDCQASHGDIQNIAFCRAKLAEFNEQQPLNPKPILSGHDLIELGYKPGPLFSKIIRAVQDAQLEQTISTNEEAREYVLQTFPVKEEEK